MGSYEVIARRYKGPLFAYAFRTFAGVAVAFANGIIHVPSGT